MQMTVTGRHFDVSEKLRSYAIEKASKLEHFYDRAMSADIVFNREASSHICEIIVKADHRTTFVAKENHEDPYVALDATVRDLERQLNKHKERFRNRKHPDQSEI